MAPKKGNQHAKKLTSIELKQQAYREYCDHLAKGKDRRGWYFEHADLTLTSQTLEVYIQNEPDVFKPIQKQLALSKGFQKWEAVVEEVADGTNKEGNVAALQMLMRNKFGWDKQEDKKDAENFKPNASKLLEIWSQ